MNKIINKKDTVIISIGFIIFSILFSFANLQSFALIYFAAVALTVFFANKIFSLEKLSIPNPLIVAFTAAVCNSTAYEIFYTEHANLNRLAAAFAVAAFLAGFFAAVGVKNFSYSIVIAPVLCFLNLRIAICYSALLACISAINMYSDKHSKVRGMKKSKKKTKTKLNLNLIALVVSILSLVVSVYLLVEPDGYLLKENFSYYINTFKNNPAVIIASVYLFIKLLKNNFNAKLPMIISVVVLLAAVVGGYFIAGMTLSALMCMCILLLLSYYCIQDDKTFQSIKEDYHKQKFLFWVLIVYLLR